MYVPRTKDMRYMLHSTEYLQFKSKYILISNFPDCTRRQIHVYRSLCKEIFFDGGNGGINRKANLLNRTRRLSQSEGLSLKSDTHQLIINRKISILSKLTYQKIDGCFVTPLTQHHLENT